MVAPTQGKVRNRSAAFDFGIAEDRAEAVAGTVREAEVRPIDVVVKRTVAAELMEHHTIVAGEPDGINRIRQVRQHVGGVQDAERTVAGAVGVDLDPVQGAELAAMIDRKGEQCAAEIGLDVEPQLADQAKEAVAMVIGVDRGEIVGSRVEVEVGAGRLEWRGGRWRLIVLQLNKLAGERVVGRDRWRKTTQQHCGANRV